MRPLAALLLLLPAAAAFADDRPTVIVVVGAEGSAEYAPYFAKWADRWADAAKRAGANLVQVGRDGASQSKTDKELLQASLDQASKKDLNQPVWLVLIGHGTYDRREAKFNLRGPDVSDAELASWLANCRRPLAVINCSSASSPFLSRLSGEGRVIITATRSGAETNFARFGEHMSATIVDPAADLDKDGQTSLLEAFLAASHGVEEFYKKEGRLATEHALLDDNGDGMGIPADWFQGTRATKAAKDGAALDGARAHQWHLIRSPAEQAMPPDLRARRDELELKIESLRGKKATLAEDEYYKQLDELLLQLARVYEQHPRSKR
jgi:hypothetical protein